MPDLKHLLREAPFGFVGTVERMGAGAMPDLPVDAHTAVVRVDRVLQAPPAFGGLEGSSVTLQTAPGEPLLKPGSSAAFFAEGPAFGESVALRELGRAPVDETEAPLARAARQAPGDPVADLQEEVADERVREHAAEADAVILGRVMALAKAADPQPAEHDPDWWRATLQVFHVERGDVRRRPAWRCSTPTAWTSLWRAGPKPKASQGGHVAAPRDPGRAEAAGALSAHAPGGPAAHPAARAAREAGGELNGMLAIVNMIPQSLSGETNQDSEPNLAVNPAKPTDMVGDGLHARADGRRVRPDLRLHERRRDVVAAHHRARQRTLRHRGHHRGLRDAPAGALYAGILSGTTGRLQILRSANFAATTPMTSLVDRDRRTSPGWWPAAGRGGDLTRPCLRRATTTSPSRAGAPPRSTSRPDAATAAAPAGFAPHQVERRATVGQDGPPVRVALHRDGTVYAAFQRWVTRERPERHARRRRHPRRQLGHGREPVRGPRSTRATARSGMRVATGCFVRFNATMGQERIGRRPLDRGRPGRSKIVWLAWCDRVGGAAGTDWTLHVRRSTDRGETWSPDVRTITNAKNPALAVNSTGSGRASPTSSSRPLAG